jgi:hypothetical protein
MTMMTIEGSNKNGHDDGHDDDDGTPGFPEARW